MRTLRHQDNSLVHRLNCEELASRLCLSAVSFSSHPVVEPNVKDPESVFAADMDSDGDLDVLFTSSSHNKIGWYENTDGRGAFGMPILLSTEGNSPGTVHAADIDGDGDTDVITVSRSDNALFWYENADAEEHFSQRHVITAEASGARSIFTVDMDSDGDLDILLDATNVAWIENTDGKGSFAASRAFGSASSIFPADADGDGDVDVFAVGGNFERWYENIGATGEFVQHALSRDSAQSIWAADMDGDGDMDWVTGSTEGITWRQNMDGRGTFGARIIIEDFTGVSHIRAVADLDNDGDLDMVTGSPSFTNLSWRENIDGLGTFGARPLNVPSGSTYVADLDGDLDLDVVATSSSGNTITWAKNTNNGFVRQRDLSAIVDDPISLFAADIDGDGDLDAISASNGDDKIAWFDNIDGNGTFGEPKVVTRAVQSPTSLHAADVDSDGDADLLLAFDGNIAWFENLDGRGTFGQHRMISESDSARRLTVAATDVDLDGDLDVVAPIDGGIAWYENTDGLGEFSEKHVVGTSHSALAKVADMDNDGDVDVLAANSRFIAWYENDGGGDFGESKTVTPRIDVLSSIETADIDGDGDQDLLWTTREHRNGTIAWIENTDGLGQFGEPRVVSITEHGSSWAESVDVDGDGDLDVVSRSAGLVWHENTDGKGTFGAPLAIGASSSSIVHFADLDGDDDADMLAVVASDTIAWHENGVATRGLFRQPRIASSEDENRLAFPADLDGDGDIDLLSDEEGILTWHENIDGKGKFDREKAVNGSEDDLNGPGRASAVFAADIDGDSDMDVFFVPRRESQIIWHKNIGGERQFGPEQLLDTDVNGVNDAMPADIDNDGDVDILLLSSDGSVVWYPNVDGLGNFGKKEVLVTDPGGVRSVYAIDLNGDHGSDLIWTYGDSQTGDFVVVWQENIDGNGAFGSPIIIQSESARRGTSNAADIDGDGDMDVVSFTDRAGIAWFENIDGRGTFGAKRMISSEIGTSARLGFAADIDGDGDADVLSGLRLVWYENLDGRGTFSEGLELDGRRVSEPRLADIDGDGDQDIVVTAAFILWYERLPNDAAPGDANLDGRFDQQDIVQVLQGGKYRTGETATFEEGDWSGDGVFDQLDVVCALQTGGYLKGASAVKFP